LTKFDISFTIIGLNGIFTHTKKYYDNEILYHINEEGSIIQDGYTIKDLDNQDKLTKVYKSCKMRFNILDKNSIQPDKIISMIESVKLKKKMC
jgi:hypothetical protein